MRNYPVAGVMSADTDSSTSLAGPAPANVNQRNPCVWSVDDLPYAFAWVDWAGQWQTANAAFLKLFRIDSDAFVRTPMATSEWLPGREVLSAAFPSVVNGTMRRVHVDSTMAGFDGQAAPIRISLASRPDGAGAILYVEDDEEAAANRREPDFRRMVEMALEGVWQVDADYRTVFANERMAEILGTTRDALSTKAIHDFMDDEGRRESAEFEERRRKGITERHDFRFLRSDGREVWAQMSVAPLNKADGSFDGALALVTDVTSRRQAEQALRESELRFRQIAETVDEVFWMADVGMTENLYVSPAYERVWGRTIASLKANPKSFIDAIHPDDRERAIDAMQGPRHGKTFVSTYRVVRPDGSCRWISDRGYPIRDHSGQVIRCVGSAKDITETHLLQMENSRRAEALEKLVLDESPSGVVTELLERIAARFPGSKACLFCAGSSVGPDPMLVAERAEAGWGRRIATVLAGSMQRISNECVWVNVRKRADLGTALDLVAAVDGSEWVMAVRNECGDAHHVVLIVAPAESVCTSEVDAPTAADIRILLLAVGRRRLIDGLRALTMSLEFRVAERTAEVLRQAEEIRQREEQFSLVLDSTNDGFWDCDVATGHIFYSNRYLSILGYTSGEVEPTLEGWSRLLHPEDSRRVLAVAEGLRTADADWMSIEYRMRRKDGTYAWILDRCKVVRRDASGTPTRLVGMHTDITERKSAEVALELQTKALQDTNARLAQALDIQAEFVARTSHELRTPLSSIMAVTELLLDPRSGSLAPYQQTKMRSILESCHHLLDLINEILDLAKIEAGQMGVEIVDCDALAIARECLDSIGAQAARRNLKLSLEPARGSIGVRADPKRIRQILLNLLGNAIKFTPKGGSVSLRVMAPEPGSVQLAVIDTGIGIARENLGRLFQPFVQLESGLARNTGGTGLGLCLVKRFVDLQHGSVSVESVVGEGSSFIVTLPASTSDTQKSVLPESSSFSEPKTTESNFGVPPLRVAVTDDNEMNRLLVVDYLRMSGFDAWGEPDGPSLLKVIEESPPDAILLDVQMPGMDGLEVTRRIRALPDRSKSTIPIIGLTALAMAHHRDLCLSAGMTKFQSKPSPLKSLPGLIASCLQPDQDSLRKQP